MLEKIKGGLVVSCQALPDEPLHSSFIMGRMALAAKQEVLSVFVHKVRKISWR